MPRKTLIQHRTDTATNWTSANPTLASGEIGVESNTNKFKIGNGTAAWADLAYQGGLSTITATSPLAYNSGTNTISISATPTFTTVNATTFVGALTGNADTATAADTADEATHAVSADTATSATTATTATKATKITASGLDRTVFVSSTTPTGMVTGDIWIKTT